MSPALADRLRALEHQAEALAIQAAALREQVAALVSEAGSLEERKPPAPQFYGQVAETPLRVERTDDASTKPSRARRSP
jgi:hypothetical protein